MDLKPSRSGSTRRWRKLRAFVLRRDLREAVNAAAEQVGLSAIMSYLLLLAGSMYRAIAVRFASTCHDRLHGR